MDFHDNPWHYRDMAYYQRKLNLPDLLVKKSFFLFGPRSVGKTTLIKTQLPKAEIYDLLDAETFRTLVARPKILEERHQKVSSIVVIDEIQKLPSLLDEVHRLIEKRNMRFLLTGSSARKLRRGGVNLLAGRAWEAQLFPLTFGEIKDFELLPFLNTSGLPAIYGNPESKEELAAYVGTYLSEEISAEAATKNLAAFSEFLTLCALSNGEEINFESMARDCGISPSTLKAYFQILNDTLVGFQLPGYIKTKKRKAITRAKHYLFDIGIVNTLCQRGIIEEKSELFGKAFEHFIILEIRAYNSYARKMLDLNYWRSTSQYEVDLIIGGSLAIEIKATDLVKDKHLKGLRALKEEKLQRKFICISTDPERRKTEDGIEIWPWRLFLQDLWKGNFF